MIIGKLNITPFDSFPFVFVLFIFENVLENFTFRNLFKQKSWWSKTYQIEVVLQVFVGIVDTQLFKTVLYAEIFKTKNI